MTGCSHNPVVIAPKVACERPAKPVLERIPENATDREVIRALLYELNEAVGYSKGLESTVKCLRESVK